MHSRGIPNARAFRSGRLMVVLIAILATIFGTAVPAFATPAPVAATSTPIAQTTVGGPVQASLAGFSAGNIISDAVFTDKSTMTEAQIQAFFNSKVKTCRGGYDKYGPIICLKDFKITSVNRPADKYCPGGYTGAANESAARIIYRVSQACNINPQVLIVMLQKEQSLVTHTWPSAYRYDKALGQGCPDGGVPCDPNFVGFFHQIYGAARRMHQYMEDSYFNWYPAGKTSNIYWNAPKEVSPGVWKYVCGAGPVYIANKATSALYYYTPYQPNAAALRAGYGTGDSCSSYGNRNFYNYFTDWFGSTQASPFTVGPVTVGGTAIPGQVVAATSQFTPAPTSTSYQWYRNGAAISGATQQKYSITTADGGASLEVLVTARRSGYATATARSAATAVGSIAVGRVSGVNREATAVEVSREAWPSGTSTVFLTNSMGFADALSGAAVTGRSEASLLMTPASSLPQIVADELRRLAPTRVVLMGGTGVLTPALATQVSGILPKARVERVAGLDRYATSRAVVESGGASTRLMIAAGGNFPDGLSAAAVGSSGSTPVLLVDGAASTIPAESVATIRKIGAQSVTIVGGAGVVSSGIEAQMKALGLTVSRLQGPDRFKTNFAVNDAAFPSTALRVLVASGNDFPDALSATVLAGRWKVPLLLTEQNCIVDGASNFLRTRKTETVTLIGGAGVLSEDGVKQLRHC